MSGLIATALVVSACSGGTPAARGFGSHELEPTRDSTVTFLGNPGPGVLIYGTGGPTFGPPANYWSLNLATGAVQDFGSQFPPPAPSPSSMPPPQSPYTCALTTAGTATNAYTLQIVGNSGGVATDGGVVTDGGAKTDGGMETDGGADADGGAETDIANVVSYAQCPGADGLLTAFVVDASGNTVLMTGPFTDLQPVPLALLVSQVEWWFSDGTASNTPTAVTVLGAAPSAPDELGLYSVDLTSYAITTDVPPVPASVGWATGATPAGSLQSTSLIGGGPYTIFPTGDHYVYSRVMSDAQTTVFAGPFSSGAPSELALFQVPPGTPTPTPAGVMYSPSLAAYFQLGPQLAAWQLGGAAGASSDLVIWDDSDRQVIACPSSASAFLSGQGSADGSKVLFVTPQQCCSYRGSGPLSLLSLPAAQGALGSCTLLAAANVVTAAFSPDNSSMFWLVQPPTGEAQLWAAASDGSGARMIGTGLMQSVQFVGFTGAKVELFLDGDLVWLDLHDSTVQLHYVAEQVFEEIYDIEGPWLITGYDYSTQDSTGTLGLVNRDTGEKRPISPEVAQFTVLAEKEATDGGLVTDSTDAGVTSVLSVVYLVRGRNPSPQDGIWLATITVADLK